MEYAKQASRTKTHAAVVENAGPAPAAYRAARPANPEGGRRLHMDGALAERVRQSFGIHASEVKLRESDEVERMGEVATTQGNVIRFAPGQYRPDTQEGQKTLGHELAHVVQQAKGGVQADVPGTSINASEALEAAGDAAGAGFAAGTLSAAGPVSAGGASAASAPMQGFLGFGRRKREKEAKQIRADTMRAGVAAYNSRGDSVTRGLTANLQARGEVPNAENTSPQAVSRSAQSMMIPGNESYNAQVTEYFKYSGHSFGQGNSTFSRQGLADPQHVARFKQLVKPHVDFMMNSNINAININDPESMRANMEILTRAGMINQFIGDARTQIPDLAGSVERTNEFYTRLHFANNAFVIARAQVAKEQGYKDDRSLYTDADYNQAVESRVDSNEVKLSKAKPEDHVKRFNKKRAKFNLNNREANIRTTGLLGQTNYQGYMQERTRQEQLRNPTTAPAPVNTAPPNTAVQPNNPPPVVANTATNNTPPVNRPQPPSTMPNPGRSLVNRPQPTSTMPDPGRSLVNRPPVPQSKPKIQRPGTGGGDNTSLDPTSPDFKPSPELLERAKQANSGLGFIGKVMFSGY